MISASLPSSRLLWLGLGLLLGLTASAFWPQSPVHAVATDRYENFAICTAVVDNDGSEGLFVLDNLTGDLKGFLLNGQTGKFAFSASKNIMGDMGIAPNQKPKFLLVTGNMRVRAGGGRIRGSNSVLYVAELTTGRLIAYTLVATGRAGVGNQGGTFGSLDMVQFRQVQVRPQIGAGVP